MRQRQVTRICMEGWYYLFIVLFIVGGAVLGEVSLLVLLAGMMVGPLLFNWRFVQLSLRSLAVTRRLPHRICAGQELTVAITAENRRTRLTSWTVMVEDRTRWAGAFASRSLELVRLLLPRVAAGQTCTGQYRTLFARRGRYKFGPSTYLDPFSARVGALVKGRGPRDFVARLSGVGPI